MAFDMLTDVASILDTNSLGVFDPEGSSGNIFLRQSPDSPLRVIVLFSEGGLKRELKYRGDIRYPNIHIEVRDSTPDAVEASLQDIADTLEQVLFDMSECTYFFRLLGEPFVWKESNISYRGSLNFNVTQTIK